MKMQHMTRLTDWYVRTQTRHDSLLWLLLQARRPAPSALNAAYRQRQRNRTKRRR